MSSRQFRQTEKKMKLAQRIRNIDSLRLASDALHRMEERQFKTVVFGMPNESYETDSNGLIGIMCLVGIFIGAVFHYWFKRR